jgi:DNA-binding transcriptional LysR family regulator
MEHRQLRYFVTPVEELHFSRAAAREHIVQSPLSQQLQRLERKLGILLLDRTTHHVQLTPAGSALLVEAGAPEQVRQLASGRLNVGIGECR